MSNVKTKKAVKKAAPKKEFSVELKVNDEVYKAKTDNLAEALIELQPPMMKTHVTITVKKGKKVAERFLLLQKAKLMFRSRIGVDAFVNTLIFK